MLLHREWEMGVTVLADSRPPSARHAEADGCARLTLRLFEIEYVYRGVG